VRSATLDTWLPEQVQVLSSIGNRRANLFYEARLPSNVRRPTPHDTVRPPPSASNLCLTFTSLAAVLLLRTVPSQTLVSPLIVRLWCVELAAH
jgi:hypothetical protein